MRRAFRLLWPLLGVAGVGCTVNDTVGTLGGRVGYCARPGPAWMREARMEREACAGRLAARTFPRALCVCGGLASSGVLTTHTGGASGTGEASVGVEGFYSTSTGTTIDGALQVDGSRGLEVSDSLTVAGTLRSQGPVFDTAVAKNASVVVGGDAWVGGRIALRALKVGGLLYQAEGAMREVTEPFPESQVRSGPLPPVASACGCEAPPPVAELVAANAPLSHNEDIGLAVDAFEDVPAGETRARELPCGRFVLSGITGQGTVQLTVTGRATLFVKEAVAVRRLEVRLAEEGELDLLVAGGLEATERLVLDAGSAPTRLRVYVGGALGVPKEHQLAAYLSAPGATVVMSEPLTLSGALNVGALTHVPPLTVSYDPAVRALAEACSGGE